MVEEKTDKISPLILPIIAVIGLTECFGLSAWATNRENKNFIRNEKARLEQLHAPKDSIDRFNTHGFNLTADVNDAFNIKAYGQRVDSVLARATDSAKIAKIIPQATPAQICTTLTRLGR